MTAPIYQEIEKLGPLKGVAMAIVDYVRCVSWANKGEFHNYSGEWTLEPDSWINMKFVYTRKFRINLSLGVYPVTLDRLPELEVKPGRYPAWSRISISSPRQLPAVMRCVEDAYYFSDNKYRNKNGKPKKPVGVERA